MIISLNPDPKNIEFEKLLSKSISVLQNNSEIFPKKYADLHGNKQCIKYTEKQACFEKTLKGK